MAVKPAEVAKIAWAIGKNLNLSEEAVLSIANSLWILTTPGGQLWKECPKEPDA